MASLVRSEEDYRRAALHVTALVRGAIVSNCFSLLLLESKTRPPAEGWAWPAPCTTGEFVRRYPPGIVNRPATSYMGLTGR
jgi:hypothetical protein